jgi:cysteine desulfurase
MSMNGKPRRIYLDHAATTAVDPRVLEAMLPYFSEQYGNPSSVHQLGARARAAVEAARATVAQILGARPGEIVFTSCGTESDNLALRGVAQARRAQGNQIITSAVEHHAVSNTCRQLQEQGCEVVWLPVDRYGLVDPDDVGRAITSRTALISVMYANNEVGTIEPLAAIGQIAAARGIPLHTDAVQAAGSLDLDVNALNVDLLSISGHKFYAPKGVGALYVRHGTPLQATQTGGSQERHRRAGTENVPYIVGLARALELAYQEREGETQLLRGLRDQLIAGVLERIPYSYLTGHPERRLSNSASFVFEGIVGEAALFRLDLAGIAASTGSACAAGEEEESGVLAAMGVDARLSQGSLRLTLGRENTADDVAHTVNVLAQVVSDLRVLSPVPLGHHV